MAYIGREPQYGAFEKQTLTADGSTTTFTLTYVVGSEESILVSVAGVIQQPGSAYNLGSGGTQIIFTAAPDSGATVFLIYLGVASDVAALLSTAAITGQTAETSVADDDLILIYDTSAGQFRKMTKANFAPAVSLTYNTRTATGDGSTTAFTVTSGATNDSVIVTENGVIQVATADYAISGTTLTFTTAPASGVAIKILELPVSSS